MKDASRFNLVTNFVCTQCGEKLALSYDYKKAIEYAPEKSDGITGANKVELQVGVHPCGKCYAEVTEPLDALRRVLNKGKK